MSYRDQQISSVLHRAIQSVIDGGLSDPRLQAMITVTSVLVSQDRRTASVNVSIMPEKSEKLAMHGLRDAAKHIRRAAANKTRIHHMPILNFKVDKGMKAQAAIYQTLAEIDAERQDKADNQIDVPDSTTENDS